VDLDAICPGNQRREAGNLLQKVSQRYSVRCLCEALTCPWSFGALVRRKVLRGARQKAKEQRTQYELDRKGRYLRRTLEKRNAHMFFLPSRRCPDQLDRHHQNRGRTHLHDRHVLVRIVRALVPRLLVVPPMTRASRILPRFCLVCPMFCESSFLTTAWRLALPLPRVCPVPG
jgi:hypothetical protein